MTTTQQQPEAKKFGWSHILLILALGILLFTEAFCGYHLHTLSSQRRQMKEDYSTINNITFGIFSVNQWRDKIAAVVNAQVKDYHMTPEQKKQLLAEVEQELHGLVNKTVATVNKPQSTIGGKLKKFAFKSFVNTDEIQAQVPSFAKTIVNKVSSPASQKRLKAIASGKINELEKETYDSTETASAALTSYMYRKYHVANPVDFDKQLKSRIANVRAATFNYLFVMLGCILAVLGLWWFLRSRVHLHAILFIMSLLFAFVLILVGTTTSIVEVDARIKELDFLLLGQKVAFENQVLFFQSKSLAGIVEVLIQQSKPDAVVVGILILVFVILFPVVRLIFTGVHLLMKKRSAENNIVKYFAFQFGHWAMADVMVVGILMTYIGLNGILDSQLTNLNIHNSVLNTFTTNYTTLQSGYYIFVAFVLYSLALTAIFKRIAA